MLVLSSIQMHTHQFQLKSHRITIAINITIRKKNNAGLQAGKRYIHPTHTHTRIDKNGSSHDYTTLI